MNCRDCAAPNRDGAAFCRQCGATLRVADPPFDEAASTFCDRCGERIGGGRAALHLCSVDRLRRTNLLDDAAPLESERKSITVMFADLCGSTRLISGRDPEHAWGMLEPVLQLMMDAVATFGGTVNQIQGDGIMAMFGAPMAVEDHALRACYAALRMHAAMRRGPGAEVEAGGQGLKLHLGIATGEVLVGTIGADLSRVYNAAGEVIHVAARLQRAAVPGQTLCTGETLSLASGGVLGRPLGRTAIRDTALEIDVFEVVGEALPHTRFEGSLAHGLRPLLNRVRELDMLRHRLVLALAGEGQVVAIGGEAGMGKSRLAHEVTRLPEASEARVLSGVCLSIGTQRPYHAFAGLLRSLCGIVGSDDAAVMRNRIARALDERDLATPLDRAALAAVLGLETDDPDWTRLDPTRRRDAIRGALLRVIEALADEAPLILTMDDLQWADPESKSLLDVMAGRVAGRRVLLLVNHRSGHALHWPDGPGFAAIELEPLADAEAGALLERTARDHGIACTVTPDLLRRIGGNPLFLEEVARGFDPAAPVAAMPSSVRAILSARIDGLDPWSKRLVQQASVLGPRFPAALFRRLNPELSQDVLGQALGRLRRVGMLRETSLYPEPEYGFSHDLVLEAAYEGLTFERRRRMHGAALVAIEATYPDRVPEQVEALAHHAAMAEAWPLLARYARAAGRRAAGQSAYRLAARQFEQAVRAHDRMGAASDTREAIDTRFELRNVLFPLGEIARDLEHMRAAEVLARAGAHADKLAWIASYIARDLGLLGRPRASLEAGARALGLARSLGDATLSVLVQSYVGQAQYVLGDFAAAAACMRRVLADIAGTDPHERFGLPLSAQIAFRCWLLWACARLGETEEADRVSGELVALAALLDEPLCRVVVLYSRGMALVHRGDCAGAVALLRPALALCQEWDFSAWFTNVASCLGYALARTGAAEAGIDLLWQAVRRSRTLGLMVSHAIEVGWLAEALAIAGRLDEAATLAAEAAALARAHEERGNEAQVLRIAARISRQAAAGSEPEHAATLAEALDIALACGMRPLAALCRADMAA